MLRKATKTDIVEMSNLWLEMVTEMRPDWTPNVDWWRNIAESASTAGTYHALVACKENTIIGFVDWFIFPEPSTGRIHAVAQHLFLKPEYRGNGVGGRLCDEAINLVIAEGIRTMDLFCFDGEREMWERRGFVKLRNLLRREV